MTPLFLEECWYARGVIMLPFFGSVLKSFFGSIAFNERFDFMGKEQGVHANL